MKLLTIGALFAFVVHIPGSAHADLVTLPSKPTSPSKPSTVIDFGQFANSGYNFTFGPQQIGEPVGLDVVFTATPLGGGISGNGSVLGSGSYGLSSNGEWGGDKTYSGLDSALGTMTYKFNFGTVSEVGGFMNYAPLDPQLLDVTIAAIDTNGNVLESYILPLVAPIATPGGFNSGAFRGIRRRSADIAGFQVSNGYVVLDDLTFGSSSPVPEPSTLVLLGGGIVGLVARHWRRRVA